MQWNFNKHMVGLLSSRDWNIKNFYKLLRVQKQLSWYVLFKKAMGFLWLQTFELFLEKFNFRQTLMEILNHLSQFLNFIFVIFLKNSKHFAHRAPKVCIGFQLTASKQSKKCQKSVVLQYCQWCIVCTRFSLYYHVPKIKNKNT